MDNAMMPQNPSSPETVEHIGQEQNYETPLSETEHQIDKLMQELELGTQDLLKQSDIEMRLQQLESAAEDDCIAHYSEGIGETGVHELDQNAIFAENLAFSSPEDNDHLLSERQNGNHLFYYTVAQQYLVHDPEFAETHNSIKTDSFRDGSRKLTSNATSIPLFYAPGEEPEFQHASDDFSGVDECLPKRNICTVQDDKAIVPQCEQPRDDSDELEFAPNHLVTQAALPQTNDCVFFDDDSAEHGIAVENTEIAEVEQTNHHLPVFYYEAIYRNSYIAPSSSQLFKVATQTYLPDTQNILLQLQETEGFEDTANGSNAFSHGEETRRAENIKLDVDNQMDITDITQNDVEVYSMTEFEEQAPTVLYEPNEVEEFQPFLKSPEKEATEPVNSQTVKLKIKFRWSSAINGCEKVFLRFMVK